jgi:leader peptidase (prepilin peptidase)/N-methyltransferase
MIIPNWLNLTLGLSGLTFSSLLPSMSPFDSALGAVLGGLLTAGVRAAHLYIRDVEGLGLGDVKLAMAAGTWTGFEDMPPFLFIGAVLGFLFALSRIDDQRSSTGSKIPFGPSLAASLLVVVSFRLVSGAPLLQQISF